MAGDGLVEGNPKKKGKRKEKQHASLARLFAFAEMKRGCRKAVETVVVVVKEPRC
jgi:hypothetical protein